jgi:hypothetical protein
MSIAQQCEHGLKLASGWYPVTMYSNHSLSPSSSSFFGPLSLMFLSLTFLSLMFLSLMFLSLMFLSLPDSAFLGTLHHGAH